jgi:hypothetical protein
MRSRQGGVKAGATAEAAKSKPLPRLRNVENRTERYRCDSRLCCMFWDNIRDMQVTRNPWVRIEEVSHEDGSTSLVLSGSDVTPARNGLRLCRSGVVGRHSDVGHMCGPRVFTCWMGLVESGHQLAPGADSPASPRRRRHLEPPSDL